MSNITVKVSSCSENISRFTVICRKFASVVLITDVQYIPRNMHTVLLCFALLWLCNRS